MEVESNKVFPEVQHRPMQEVNSDEPKPGPLRLVDDFGKCGIARSAGSDSASGSFDRHGASDIAFRPRSALPSQPGWAAVPIAYTFAVSRQWKP
jgi:hypothetical protein